MSIAVIGGNIYSNHPKIMNHMHKYIIYLMSVIIPLGGNMSRGETVCYYGVKQTDLVKRYHVIKHLHDRKLWVHSKDASTKVLFSEETDH